jgi:hypothetical protein
MERIKLVFKTCDYVVKENDGVVIALITAHIDKYMKNICEYFDEVIKVTGVARCHRDNFDETTGKKLARAKAERSAYIAARNILRNKLRDINKDISTFNTSIDFFNECIDHQDDYINEF